MVKLSNLLVLLIYTIPFDKFKIAGILSLSNVLIIFLTILILFSNFKNRIKIGKVDFILFCILLISFLSSITSYNKIGSFRLLITLSASTLLVVLIKNICVTDKIFKSLIRNYFYISGLISVFAIFQFLFFLIFGHGFFSNSIVRWVDWGTGMYVLQSNAFFDSGIILGHYLLLPVISGVCMWDQIKYEKLIKISVILSFLALLLTFSRGAVLPIIIFLILRIIYKFNNSKKSVKYTIRFAAFIFCILLVVPFSKFIINFNQISIFSRVAIINSSINTIAKNPIFGSGLGSKVGYSLSDEQYSLFQRSAEKSQRNFSLNLGVASKRSPHNTILQIAVDIGIVGLIFFLYLVFFAFKRMNTSSLLNRNDFLGKIGFGIKEAFKYSIFCSVFSSLFYVKHMWFLIGLMFAGASLKSKVN